MAGPKKRLRTRVTLFFLIAALPAVMIAVASIVLIDRVITAEIQKQASDTFSSVTRGLNAETARVEAALGALARHDSLRGVADAIEHGAALDRAEGVAGALAAETGLEVLAVARGLVQLSLS